MDNRVDLILEKLSFDRMFRPQIDLMWRVINKYYVSSKYDEVRNNFNFPDRWVQFPENLEDFQGTRIQIGRKYDFNKAKRLFIKEPYVVFCIDSNEVSFDFSKDSVRDNFFENLDWKVYSNYLSYIKKSFPTVYRFLVNTVGYDANDPSLTVMMHDTEAIKDYPAGRELFAKALKMLEKGLSGKEAVPPHSMGWIDRHLYPMFIWDTQEGFVYSCNVSCERLNLDRRSLNKRDIVRALDSVFMGDELSPSFSSRFGFVRNHLDITPVLL